MSSDMNRLDAALEIFKATLAGKTIQKLECCSWGDITKPDLNHLVNNPTLYRIKPEVTLRPWKAEEVPVGAIVRLKGPSLTSVILSVEPSVLLTMRQAYSFQIALDTLLWKWPQETEWKPCGIPN